MQALCILAAGRGERLKNTFKFHKCLAPLKNKAVISHIIEKVPIETDIIIALGHQANLIMEYCQAAHPERKFTFVLVDNYDKEGSGPGYSLYCCKEHLQRPFYLSCGDCIVDESFPDLSNNWLGVSCVLGNDNTKNQWSTADISEHGMVVKFKNKSNEPYHAKFIGLAGIKDYKNFWKQLSSTQDKEFEMVSAFYRPETYSEGIKGISFHWLDTGTPENYNIAQRYFDYDLENLLGMKKNIDEITYKVNNKCVKIFGKKDIAAHRILRNLSLFGDLVPKLTFAGENTYAYDWIAGETMYQTGNVKLLEKFLGLCEEKLWFLLPKDGDGDWMKEQCSKFYQEKTLNRLNDYINRKGSDHKLIVNGRRCEVINYYLARIDWNLLADGIPSNFHGDLQFDNIIYSRESFANEGRFYLIDCRDSFGDNKAAGDLYYDLAKLYAGLSMNFNSIKLGEFDIGKDGNRINYKFHDSLQLRTMREFYEAWLLKKGYNLYKIKILTALIYLNMAPLHTEGFDELLFHHSKYLLSILV